MEGISALILHEKDNVGTALRDLEEKEEIQCDRHGEIVMLKVLERIPFGFKFSIIDIDVNESVVKYGQIIGRATSKIPSGFCVHIHNVESMRGRGDW